MNDALGEQLKIDAAICIQAHWRGHVVRQVFGYLLSIHKMRSPYKIKKVERKSRFGPNVERLIWARKYYEPEGGWPGKADFLEYDMWEYSDKPPKGREYGLKTYKVKAAPNSDTQKEILRGDKNSWVGIPMGMVSEKESRPKPKPHVQHMMDTSPYRMPETMHSEKKKVSVDTVSRLQGDVAYKTLGWSPSMIDRTVPDKDLIDKVKAHGITPTSVLSAPSALSYLGDATTLPGSVSPDGSPSKSMVALQFESSFGKPEADMLSPSNQALSGSYVTNYGDLGKSMTDFEKQERHVRKTMDVNSTLQTVSQIDSVTLWHNKNTYVNRRKESSNSRVKSTNELKNIQPLKASSWGKIKSVVEQGLFKGATTVAPMTQLEEFQLSAGEKPGDVIKELGGNSIREKKVVTSVWPTKPKPHYKLRYTWLPQPLVKNAVETLYYGDNATEDGVFGDSKFEGLNRPKTKSIKDSTFRSNSFSPRGKKQDDESSASGKSPPKQTAMMSTLISNMNRLSAISSVTDCDENASVHSRYSRTRSPGKASPAAKLSHPYHWL